MIDSNRAGVVALVMTLAGFGVGVVLGWLGAGARVRRRARQHPRYVERARALAVEHNRSCDCREIVNAGNPVEAWRPWD